MLIIVIVVRRRRPRPFYFSRWRAVVFKRPVLFRGVLLSDACRRAAAATSLIGSAHLLAGARARTKVLIDNEVL